MYAGYQHPLSTCFASLWWQTCSSYFQSFFHLRKYGQFSVALFLFSALWIHLQLETVVLCFYVWIWHITANMMGKCMDISWTGLVVWNQNLKCICSCCNKINFITLETTVESNEDLYSYLIMWLIMSRRKGYTWTHQQSA